MKGNSSQLSRQEAEESSPVVHQGWEPGNFFMTAARKENRPLQLPIATNDKIQWMTEAWLNVIFICFSMEKVHRVVYIAK